MARQQMRLEKQQHALQAKLQTTAGAAARTEVSANSLHLIRFKNPENCQLPMSWQLRQLIGNISTVCFPHATDKIDEFRTPVRTTPASALRSACKSFPGYFQLGGLRPWHLSHFLAPG
jgi:hypothetical protein